MPAEPAVEVTYSLAGGGQQTLRFTSAFRVGRGQDCAVRIADPSISRQHLEIYWDKGQWWAHDLQSQNGTFLNGEPVREAPLEGTTALELSRGGPVIQITTLLPPQPTASDESPAPAEDIARRYFDPSYTGPAGEHTLMVRHTFQQLKRKQSRRYWSVISLVGVLLAGAISLAVYQHWQLRKASELAVNIFYHMKTLELQVASLEEMLQKSAAAEQEADLAARKLEVARMQELAKLRQKYAEMLNQYEDLVKKIQLPTALMNDEDQIILHVARLFGECELNIPDDFAAEVKRYIRQWKATSRLETAIQRLKQNNYAAVIQQALTAQELPPQFMYLALQESSFQAEAIGPPTRYGRAKGMWQFIPDTGRRYGLNIGPQQELGEYDPGDDRHDFKKSTLAAAKYLRDIYRTDAQASGLLVMASYNWGEGNVIRLIRQMPENPQERNFWRLLQQHNIPKETYDYVLYIFSAAVIGENPRLFGFNFDNPLQASSPAGAAVSLR